jgi:hypothetical protein
MIKKNIDNLGEQVKNDYGSQTKIKVNFVVAQGDSNGMRMDIGNERTIYTLAPDQPYQKDFDNAITVPTGN